ncbi:hypothetical protein COOONC_15478 [Cooperia oncophora]
MLFRVGDFTLDGYPDLVATLVEKQSLGQIKVIDNVLCTNCDRNGTRRFEINKSIFIQPKEVALGEIKMASFFDLKEDGNLDILIEYKPFEGETKFSFIPCDDKGDVTFLQSHGSGVSWGGACASFSMSDGWGGSLKSSACQIPAGTHRALAPPYVLFGLGRSPNFVDELTIGAPLYSDALNARQHTLKQIVPNSRIVVIPPAEDGSQWLTRLYVTPSQLILQSLAVIALVCVMLLMVVAFLHYRERKEDRVERQQQSHRFHFDAM